MYIIVGYLHRNKSLVITIFFYLCNAFTTSLLWYIVIKITCIRKLYTEYSI